MLRDLFNRTPAIVNRSSVLINRSKNFLQEKFKRDYAYNNKTDNLVFVNKIKPGFPSSITGMENHVIIIRIDNNGDQWLFIWTHNPPEGINAMKVSKTDIYGNIKDQYLVGGYKTSTHLDNIIDSGVSNGKIIGSKNIIDMSNNPYYKKKFQELINYMAKPEIDLPSEYMMNSKMTETAIDLAKQINKSKIDYTNS